VQRHLGSSISLDRIRRFKAEKGLPDEYEEFSEKALLASAVLDRSTACGRAMLGSRPLCLADGHICHANDRPGRQQLCGATRSFWKFSLPTMFGVLAFKPNDVDGIA
jgi:hypothetical protein